MDQEERKLSRRTFVTGTCGTALGLAAGIGGTRYFVDKSMPPENQIPSVPDDGFWLESTTSRLTDQISLRRNHKADVVVVGGAFTGISTAFHLSETFHDRRILLLEASIAEADASGKNNGLAIEGTSEIEPIVDEWIAKERVDKAREVWEKASSGIKIIEKLIREHNLNCDWAPVDMLFSPLTPGQEEQCIHLRLA